MKQSGKRLEASSRLNRLLGAGLSASGTAIVQNPVLVGSSTAFLVVLFYVSANAMWYQPFPHPEPLVQTRFIVEREAARPAVPTPRAVVTNSVEKRGAPAEIEQQSTPPSDPRVARVQQALGELDLYDGAVDGLVGPRTRKAIEDYQKLVGGKVSGEVDEDLMKLLDHPLDAANTELIPLPVHRPRAGRSSDRVASPEREIDQAQIVKIQAGLRAFGNEGIDLDGVVGEKTKSAIREFQSLFGLPVTGEPDTALFAKMSEIGLTD